MRAAPWYLFDISSPRRRRRRREEGREESTSKTSGFSCLPPDLPATTVFIFILLKSSLPFLLVPLSYDNRTVLAVNVRCIIDSHITLVEPHRHLRYYQLQVVITFFLFADDTCAVFMIFVRFLCYHTTRTTFDIND